MREISKTNVLILGGAVMVCFVVGFLIYSYSYGSTGTAFSAGVQFAAPKVEEAKKQYETKMAAYEAAKVEGNESPLEIINPFSVDFEKEEEIDSIPVAETKTVTRVQEKKVEPKQISEVATPETSKRIGFSAKSHPEVEVIAPDYEPINLFVRIGQDAKVRSGSVIYIRTIETATIQGVEIPINTLIEGKVGISRERLDITASKVVVMGKTIANDLVAYDMQGILGLSIKNGLENEIVNDAINTGIDQLANATNIPVISRLIPSSTKKAINAPTIQLTRGGKFYLKPLYE